MQILNLEQGSPEWLEARLKYKCASEAPAVMNESKFMTRNQLLDLKKGWLSNPNSSFKEKLFEKGHEHEEQAREILELEELEDFPASVGLLDDQYLASFDGLGECDAGYMPWEHKDWNLILAENVRNGVLEPLYYWQLEHQMLVADCERIMFTCSDGTEENRVSMMYQSIPERRADLIAAWKQFDIDLESHEIEAKQEVVVAQKAEAFPLLTFEVKGTEIISNISSCLKVISERAEIEMNRKLETDQDFADKDKLNKDTKKARDKLKLMVEDVQSKFVSYSEFAGVAAEIDSVLQKMQSQGEKQVKEDKAAKKKAIEDGGALALSEHIQEVNAAINPIMLSSLMDCSVDFKSAMKNKRTIESLQNAVDSVVAEFKISANELKDKVVANLSTLRELASEYEFLFNDSPELVKKENEDLIAVIKNRISEHEESEKVRLAKIKEDAEIAAKAKLEAEQKAKEQAELIKQQNNQPIAEELSEEKTAEPDVKVRLASRFNETSQDKPEKSVHEKMNILMYALTKSCARTSFDEFLNDWELTNEDYDEIKSYMAEKLGGMNTYL